MEQLTPEERRKIYEEEKTRIEAQAQFERERRNPPEGMTLNLSPNTAGFLCYLGAWITGIIFFVLEQKNEWVRFHAAQSLVTFGFLTAASSLIGLIPFAGPPLAGLIGFGGFILWIICMVKAYQGERFRIPIAADLADQMVASSRSSASPEPPLPPAPVAPIEVAPAAEAPQTPEPPAPAAAPAATPAGPPPSAPAAVAAPAPRTAKPRDDYFAPKPGLHIAGSVIGIAWAVALLIFFNFFNDYVAYYPSNHITPHYSLFNSDISLWLPILNTTLILAIIGHAIIIVYYRPVLRNIIRFILDCFGLAVILTLLAVFPFDFSVIPSQTAQDVTSISVHFGIIAVAIGMGIALIVKFVRLIIGFARGITSAG
jgi:uncharacterized membrane protein